MTERKIEKMKLMRKILLVCMLLTVVFANANNCYASESGTVVSARIAHLGGVSATGMFRINSVSIGETDGTCIQPANNNIPSAGTPCTLYELSQTDILTKIAYLGKDASSDIEFYVVGRACSTALGYTAQNAYIHGDEVNSLMSRANALSVAPSNFKAYRVYPEGGKQQIIVWREIPNGHLKVRKETAHDSDLVKLCPENYTIAGAKFDIYASEEDANNETGSVGTLTTDENGDTDAVELREGTYYVRETAAPKGYRLYKGSPKAVTVTAGEDSTVEFADDPIFSTLGLAVKKRAEEGSDKNLSLKGAEYTVKYYKEVTNEEGLQGKTPFRTWIFRTDEDGVIKLRPEWKTGGDDLFTDEGGKVVGLIGTYTIEEADAPKGFAKTEGLIYCRRFTGARDGLRGSAELKDAETIEKEQKVDIEIRKKDSETGLSVAQGHGSLAGAIYDVFMYDAHQLENVLAGSITTDENGYGILKDLKAGVYFVKERTASLGYLLDKKTQEVLARVREKNTAVFTYGVESAEKPTTVEINKYGASAVTDDKDVPLKGATLQVIDKSTGEVAEEFVTDGRAKIIKALPLGEYILREKEAPRGYFRADDVSFTVSEDNDGYVTANMTDDRIDYRIKKADEDGQPIGGAKMQLIDKETNEVVDEWESSLEEKDVSAEVEDGRTYIIREDKVPFGYEKAEDKEFTVTREKKVQTFTMTDKAKSLSVLIVKKEKNKPDRLLEGAEMTVFDGKGNIVKDAEGKDCRGLTGAVGRISWKIPYSQYKKYYVKETKAPEGYTLNDKKFAVKVPEDYGFAEADKVTITICDEAIVVTSDADDILPYGIILTAALLGAMLMVIFRRLEIGRSIS